MKSANGPASSSSSEDVSRILRAFEESPATSGRARLRDLQKARELLTVYTPEQIENGILLGSARRTASALDRPELRSPVCSLGYFENPIAEAAGDENFTPGYAQMLRHQLNRIRETQRNP